MSGEVYINDTLVWGYERGGSYVRAHTWELLRAVRFVAGWITRVELRAGRSVELDYERGGL